MWHFTWSKSYMLLWCYIYIFKRTSALLRCINGWWVSWPKFAFTFWQVNTYIVLSNGIGTREIFTFTFSGVQSKIGCIMCGYICVYLSLVHVCHLTSCVIVIQSLTIHVLVNICFFGNLHFISVIKEQWLFRKVLLKVRLLSSSWYTKKNNEFVMEYYVACSFLLWFPTEADDSLAPCEVYSDSSMQHFKSLAYMTWMLIISAHK